MKNQADRDQEKDLGQLIQNVENRPKTWQVYYRKHSNKKREAELAGEGEKDM